MAIAKFDRVNKVSSLQQGLTRSQMDRYWAEGVVYPCAALEPHEALCLIPKFDVLRERMSNWTCSSQILKSYLVAPWVNDLVRNPKILDCVESILGPNILVWGATFFAKQPSNNLYVGWHQDLTYWGLEPADGVLTVWLALSDAVIANGAMQVVIGSHKNGVRQHYLEKDDTNMLMSAQNARLIDADQERITAVELQPGEFSMHHSLLLHGSGANTSKRPRIGLSINYISTEVIQRKNNGTDVGMLVRGVDEYGHFVHEPSPDAEFSTQGLLQYRQSIAMPGGLGTVDEMHNDIVCFENIA